MAQTIRSTDEPSAYLEGDSVVLSLFRETDPDVVRLAREADNIETAMHRCLEVGARALQVAGASLDAALVETAFDGLAGTFDRKVGQAIEEIEETSQKLLDEEQGDLAKALNRWKTEVETLFDGVFDADGKKSVLGKLERILDRAAHDQVTAIRRVVDADNEDSPLRRWRAEIVGNIQAGTEALRAAIQGLSEKISVREAEHRLVEMTAVKGFSFEDAVHTLLGEMAALHGDAAEQTGRSTGALGTQTGDEVVHLNPEDAGDEDLSIVFEFKDKKMSLGKILKELEAAAKNREAAVAVAVFSRQQHAPVPVAFQTYGSKAIVVLDKDELDGRALHLAYMWARSETRRQHGNIAEIDVQRLNDCIDAACRALSRASSVRRAHTAAKNKIDEATGQLGSLVEEVDEALDRLKAELHKQVGTA